MYRCERTGNHCSGLSKEMCHQPQCLVLATCGSLGDTLKKSDHFFQKVIGKVEEVTGILLGEIIIRASRRPSLRKQHSKIRAMKYEQGKIDGQLSGKGNRWQAKAKLTCSINSHPNSRIEQEWTEWGNEAKMEMCQSGTTERYEIISINTNPGLGISIFEPLCF